MQLFTGCYTHAVDAKNRVSVPRKMLEVLRGLGSPDHVIVTTGLDGCLFLYPPEEFTRMGSAVDAGSMGEEAIRDFARTFYSSAESCSVDKNGRMLLPEALKTVAGLEDKVVFAGVGRRVELWAPDVWAERSDRASGQYESQAKEVFR